MWIGLPWSSWRTQLVVAFDGVGVVDTSRWGGILITVVVASVGIVVSLPLGILLALGRRSQMPAVKILSVVFIEFVRGVPLITVLFMASVMLPLFLPPAWSPDKLIRALVGVALFSSAYMAEVVRAGLQAIPKGQWEASQALGLGYWQTLRFVVLPQALRVTIPNILNSYVALFKDTTLVFFVGIYDFLRTIEAARADPKWATPVTSATGYAFAALVYFVCCYSMSRYAGGIERRLAVSDRR
jgi:general L-amino acid transport system permease protein